MGAPPEDDPGAEDPAAARKRALAARIDSYALEEQDDNAGGVDVNLDSNPVPKVDYPDPLESPALKSRLQSEPNIPSPIIDPLESPALKSRLQSEPNIPSPIIGPLQSPALKSRLQSEPGVEVAMDDDDVVEELSGVRELPSPPVPSRPTPPPTATRPMPAVAPPRATAIGPAVKPPAIPALRPGMAPPPVPKVPPSKLPPIKPPAIPPPRQTSPGIAAVPTPLPSLPVRPRTPSGGGSRVNVPLPAQPRTKTADRAGAVEAPRPQTASAPPPDIARERRPSAPPAPPPAAADSQPKLSVDDVLSGGTELGAVEGGIEAGTHTPNVVVDTPLETHLESPTVIERALAALGEGGGEARAQIMSTELEARVLSDPTGAATIAYELGEHFERRLADEARAVKSYNRALGLDPSLRPNLWAIRRVFYRRQLWPNLVKLVDAEVAYARDDVERADLLLEKARISDHRLEDPDDARQALEDAAQMAPQHQGVLLELERVLVRSGDNAALLAVWERLADTVEHPARKIAYLVEVARAAGSAGEIARAVAAFEKAAGLAASHGLATAAERVARERLRIVEERGTAQDTVAAIDALASVLLAAFGPAGPGETGPTPTGERPSKATALRLELVALRRRQAQLVRKEGAADKAWDILQQALALSPGEPIVLADLTELAEEMGRYEDLAELVQSWQSVEGDPARAMTLSIRRADALLRGGQREQARALLASLEATAPGFIVLTSIAERDAIASADVAALASVYLSAANAALLGTWLGPGQATRPDAASAAALYVEAAELLAHEIATPDSIEEARVALGKALEAVSGHPAATEALLELDDVTGRVGEALARIDAAISSAPEGEGKRALVERGIRVARSHGDLDAVARYERALVELAPTDIAARWRLESTLAQLGREEERMDLLVRIAADETDAAGRGTALLAAARLRERSGGVEAATELYRQVLAVWPDDTFARESLVDLLRAQERWQELVAERRAEAKLLPDGPAARRALREAAWVLEVRIGDATQAAQVYDEWLARMPEDRAALEGAARCRASFGDRNGHVAARAALAEASPSADATWLHARALEQAGQFDEAAELYRSLITSDEPSAAATVAALALGDIAAGRADIVMRVEATAALAGRTSDPALGAALAEESGWMYALVLEDVDRAAQSFAAANALDPTRRGAHLGAALVAARRADVRGLAQAYEGLASVVDMPAAAAALLLRGAAIAAAEGDLEHANARVAAARHAAPDDTSALLVSAEVAPPVHITSDNAFAVVDPLLARAEVLEMRSTLTDDAAAAASWELDRAEALELAGRLREAGSVVASVLKARPDDVRALTALRRMATRAGDRGTAASAAYSLARLLGDRDVRLTLLRESVAVFDEPGLARNTDYAVAALRRILAIEPGAPELDRFLELLRERGDVRALVGALTDRIHFHESEGTLGATPPLMLERATIVHGTGDTESAMADLDALLERDPSNVEALRFRADLAFNAGAVNEAVALWRRYLAAETRPSRKGEIELQLAQVLAENTNDLAGAIESLERVVENAQDDLSLRERLLGLCLRANDWNRAVRELRTLARMRPTPPERAREELRLGLMLRDRLGDQPGARAALERARSLDPFNLDVVRELAEVQEPSGRAAVFDASVSTLREAIAGGPSRTALYEKLAQVHAWQGNVDGHWLALSAVEAIGTLAADQRQVVLQGRQQLVAPTRVRLGDTARMALRANLDGPLHDLWRAISPAVQSATGVDVAKLGFGRGDRIALKKLTDKHEPLATALACFAIDDVDVYITAARTGFARALAADTPILCVSSDVASASTPHDRFLLGRTVATLAEGVSSLAELRDGELAWTVAAALRAVDASIPAALQELVIGEDTSIAERAKVLKKEFSRKTRATVTQLATSRANDLAEIDAFRRGALALGHRAGLAWAGDLSVALAILDVGKGGRDVADSPAALDLVAWSVGDAYAAVREQLHLTLKGPR